MDEDTPGDLMAARGEWAARVAHRGIAETRAATAVAVLTLAVLAAGVCFLIVRAGWG
jgi:hypothetical protein